MFSNRIKNMPQSAIRKLVPFADKAKSKGIEVYHLNIGQPDIKTPPYALEKFKNNLPKIVAYSKSAGLDELRSLWANYFKRKGYDISENNIFITSGGSEAILFSLFTILDINDSLLVFEPFYTNYLGFSKISQVDIKSVLLPYENGFHLPEEEILDEAFSQVKAVLLANPNNPTGTVFRKDEIELILKLAKKHDVWIIADEVYREFVFDGEMHSFLEYDWDKIIVLDSTSKTFSACGIRVGAIISRNKEFLANVLKLGQARLCAPVLGQLLTISVFNNFNEMDKYLKEVRDEYRKRRDAIFEEIEKSKNINYKTKPEGAFYTVLELPIDDSTHFCKWLLQQEFNGKTVMLAPADGFYLSDEGKNKVRIAYVLESTKLREAIKILDEALEKYEREKSVFL